MANNKKIFPLTPNLTLISSDLNNLKVLDKRTGIISKLNLPQDNSPLSQASNSAFQEIVAFFNKNNISIQNLSDAADFVVAVDSTVLDFYLKTSDGTLEPKNGFLVEVFESGSDGKLTRLFQEDLKDPVDDNNTVEDGFTNYFTIEVDPPDGQ